MAPGTWKWYKIAESALDLDWQPNEMCLVEAGDKKITLARHKDGLYAFAWKCPHASGIMADGHINALGQVTCPLHRYRFDIKTGRNTSGEGYFMKTYKVDDRSDGLYVGWEEKSWFSF
jgi:nitrite reductase/ring-hydroxylating ferredoxin subunit